MGTLGIQTKIVIPGIKFKSLSDKNECGSNQLFQILDEKQLQYL